MIYDIRAADPHENFYAKMFRFNNSIKRFVRSIRAGNDRDAKNA